MTGPRDNALIRGQSCRFGPITVRFDDRVLTPRPWTLIQSRWAAELARMAPAGPLLELCAGAGHIGLAAAVLADRDLVQVEADPVAAEHARRNAADADFAGRVDVRNVDVESALTDGESFDVILADPPYLPSTMVSRWPEDPVRAIDGGPDGLDVVRTCVQVAAEHLNPGGALLLQVAGAEQADAVTGWIGTTGLPLVHRETRSHDAERAVALFRRD